MKFYTFGDLLKEFPFGETKIRQMVRRRIFIPMNDPLTGKAPVKGQRMIFSAEQCEKAMQKFFVAK